MSSRTPLGCYCFRSVSLCTSTEINRGPIPRILTSVGRPPNPGDAPCPPPVDGQRRLRPGALYAVANAQGVGVSEQTWRDHAHDHSVTRSPARL